jgi:adenylate cyclase
MSEVIQEQGGVINKFGGDSLLAIFGTPLYPREDHASAAVKTAQGMLHKLREFNEKQRKLGEPTLAIGIGIATGTVVVGNVGSESRLEYTVIGDTVNLASRLEELTKSHPSDILIAAPTVTHLEDAFPLENLGDQHVRGKQQPVAIYALRDTRHGPSDSDVTRSA